MTIEELLEPRYKVIADYPNNPFGTDCVYSVEQIKFGIGNLLPDTYPHLFKKLEWWEERKKEEMPEYVKSRYDGKVKRITSFPDNETSEYCMFLDNEVHPYNPSGFLPATKEEYENQKILIAGNVV